MLVSALGATLVGFAFLVLALATGTLWLAVACIVICVVGALLLLADTLGVRPSLPRRTRPAVASTHDQDAPDDATDDQDAPTEQFAQVVEDPVVSSTDEERPAAEHTDETNPASRSRHGRHERPDADGSPDPAVQDASFPDRPRRDGTPD